MLSRAQFVSERTINSHHLSEGNNLPTRLVLGFCSSPSSLVRHVGPCLQGAGFLRNKNFWTRENLRRGGRVHPGLSLALALAPARDSSPTLAAPFSAPAVPARRRPLRSAPRPAAPMQLAQFGRTEKRSVQGHQALQHRIDPPQFCVRGAKKSKHSRCHSVFATSCALNVPATASARPSSPLIKPASGSRPIVAYAHSVFATPCALNVPATV